MVTRLLIALVLAGSVTACADFFGARMVQYTDSEFYLRHYPVWISDEEAQVLANTECEKTGKAARQDSAEQYYYLDVRYVTFTCI